MLSPIRRNRLADVRHLAQGPVARDAGRVDSEGHYPLDNLAALGAAGAFAAHVDGEPDFAEAIDAMAAVGRSCGATAFLTWCQDVCGLYLRQSGNPALQATLQSHVRGATLGGTALSNPMKTFAGIERMLLHARRVPGGYRVNGALPWVSHLAPGHYCGAIADVRDDSGNSTHEIMFVLHVDGIESADAAHGHEAANGNGATQGDGAMHGDGADRGRVLLRRCPEFAGMEGTSTWGVRVNDLFVDESLLIADPARPFIVRIRPGFILLQTGMGTGLVQGCIDDMREVEPVLGHVNRFLDDRPDALQAELDELDGRIRVLARTPYDGSDEYLLDVLDAREQCSTLSLRAAQSGMLHQGARGYLMQSAPQRRLREAQFVAIVTPAIKHLRREMERLSREPSPASA